MQLSRHVAFNADQYALSLKMCLSILSMETAWDIFGRFLRLIARNVSLHQSLAVAHHLFLILYVLVQVVSESHVHDEHG
jgi:hypothetical protein